MKKDRRILIQLDAEMDQWLRDEAKRRRCSMAQIIRDLILAAMEKTTQ